MSIFPVSSSILSAPHLSGWVRQQYRLNNVKCRLIKAGINHTYLVESDSGNAILRVYSLNWRSKTEIEEEIRLVLLLKHAGLSVSYPIADAQENYIQYLQAPEGGRMAVLFSFAGGEKVLDMTLEQHYEIGKYMAGMHLHTINLELERTTYTPQVLLVDSFEKLKQFLPEGCDEYTLMQQVQKYLLLALEKADTTAIRRGTVHLDMWFDNLHINKENAITVFDFDFCGGGWLCLDVAYYILQLHIMEPSESRYHERLNSFLKGYESITPLSAEEKRLLPLLVPALHFFYLGVQSERFENYSNIFMNEVYMKRYIVARIKRWLDFNKIDVV